MQATPSSEQVVLLPNIQYEDMASLVQYMYTGQVFIHQDMLGRLLKTAQALQVKGLIEQSADRVEGIQVIKKLSMGANVGPINLTLIQKCRIVSHLPWDPKSDLLF